MLRRMMMVLVILGSLQNAEAANNTLGTATQAVLGEKRSQLLAASDVAYFGYDIESDRSYTAFCWVASLESQAAFSGFCGLEIRDDFDISMGTSIFGEPFPKGGTAVTFSGTLDRVFVRTRNAASGSQTVNVLMLDTTLASPWFFVSPGAYDSYVVIRNHTTSSLSVTVRAYMNTGGAVAGSTTVTVPANGNTYVTVSGLGIVSGTGSVTIAHTGMPGAIVANVTTLNVTAGVSFDAPASPRMVWSMF